MGYIMFGVIIGILVAVVGSEFCLDAKPEPNVEWDVDWNL